jgi:organic hydroperoxide reductase OsmC/OhrA
VTAPVGLGAIGEGRFGIMVEIHVNLPSIADRAVAEDLVEEADQRCPYSNAVRGKVPVVITVDW